MIKEWHYSTPSEYSYDASKIEVSDGLVKLKSAPYEGPAPVGWWHLNEEPPTSCDLRIVDGLDDTMVLEGGGFHPESPLSMGYSEAFYDGTFRWDDIPIPLGATVTRAYIEFVAESDWSTSEVDLLFNITGDAADDSAQLVSYEDYVARSKTTASVEFLFPKVGIGEVFQTPELKTIIQEIVDRPGWSPGSAVNIFFNAPGWPGKEDLIQVRDYDSYPTQAALLHLEYLVSGEMEAADSSTYGNTGTLHGNPAIPSMPLRELGKLNNCLNFNGNSYVSVEHSASLNITDSITIMGWVKIHFDGAYKAIVSKDPFTSYYLGTGAQDEYAISFYYGGLEFKILAAYSLDTWHHIAITFDRATTTVVLYVDGAIVATSTDFNPTVTGNEGVIGVGIQPYTDWGYVLDGSIDELLIFNQAITAEDVLNNYNAGNGIETIAPVEGYITTKPFVQPSALFHPAGIRSCDHFIETLGAGNQGQVKYTISNDGIYWFYWNGSDWVTSDEVENYNTQAEVEANISTFSVVGDFTFRAYLISDGAEAVELDQNELGYTYLAPNVWDELVVDHAVPGSFATRIDASISSRSTLTDDQVWAYVSRELTSFGTLVADIWTYSERVLTSIGSLVSDISTAVWGAVARTLTAGTRDAEIDEVKAKILEIYELYGLDPTKPLVVSKTSRQAGEINQGISTVGETTTVFRLP